MCHVPQLRPFKQNYLVDRPNSRHHEGVAAKKVGETTNGAEEKYNTCPVYVVWGGKGSGNC